MFLTDYTFQNLGLIIVRGIADIDRINRNIDLFTLIKTKAKMRFLLMEKVDSRFQI